MNEQRAQAYINLIEQLLACTDDEELNNILQANQELIDPEFLQVMENYATGLEQQGNNNPAALLRDIAQQLGQFLNPQARSIEEYQEFLLEVLQAEYDSNSDPTVVYPILQRRQHLLDDTFAQLLQEYARNVFSQGKAEEVAVIAGVIQNLCISIRQFPLRSRANNLEIAITGYQTILEVLTRDAFPYDWAIIQNDLGSAYIYRIRGERERNLELAIAAYNLSLEVYTRDAFPYDWAIIQNNLGTAYLYRIRGERANNLELAITAYNLSLEVYTRENFPEQWARSKHNLGNAYRDPILWKRAENLELAIENLELAIAAYNLSLEVYTPTSFPINCLGTGRNLGKTANLIEDWENAIKGYNLAIKAVENIRLEALNPQRQQEILSDAMDVYHGIVQSYLNLNQKDRALEYVERSKTRYLVQLLTDRDIYPKGNIPPTIITELDRLRRAIIGEEQRLAIQEQTRNRGVILTLDEQKQPILNDYTHLNQLKQELNQLIDREITPIDPTFSLTQKVESIPLSEIQSLIDQDTAILEWYIAGDSIMAFIVTNEGLIPPNPPSKGLIPPNPPSKAIH
ncbi:Argininosuccinate lyase [Microcystis aeruginosa NIES-2549]|uniref:Argininosuccinate lyase n=1 Tax=Microcystis aeruginosa NIES-2549 TaxID=1641812 RepID=A0A0F6RMP2_MICAE|nr:Argininosuccinate lyase [Microcystis aeruginosa NIES-2549]AOC53836.1 Argininosuccinate lyase [Microcystis aeruginosa NIES-2481]